MMSSGTHTLSKLFIKWRKKTTKKEKDEQDTWPTEMIITLNSKNSMRSTTALFIVIRKENKLGISWLEI
jgi:hypothetical protein